MGALRILIGYFISLFIGILGVFIFGGGTYCGITVNELARHIEINIYSGLYETVWISFRYNMLNLFTSFNAADFTTLFLPPFFAWLSAGFVFGLTVFGIKRGLFASFMLIFSVLIYWLVLAVLAGANLTFIFIWNLYVTGGGFLTGVSGVFLGGFIGGFITRHRD